jgi:hypothetical protein
VLLVALWSVCGVVVAAGAAVLWSVCGVVAVDDALLWSVLVVEFVVDVVLDVEVWLFTSDAGALLAGAVEVAAPVCALSLVAVPVVELAGALVLGVWPAGVVSGVRVALSAGAAVVGWFGVVGGAAFVDDV